MIILILSGILGTLGSSAAAPTNASFPEVSGVSLERKKYDLPRGFAGGNNLVIITFQREQQKDADTWVDTARQFERTSPGFHYYELAALERRGLLSRWWWESFMRNGTSDEEIRSRTIVLYVNKKQFRQELNIPDEKQVYSALVSHDGAVLWHSTGPLDENKRMALLQQLNSSR